MRKRLLLFVLMLVASCAALWAQAPQAIAYQSVLRNTSGVLITNSTVSVRISICQGSSDGVAVYVERHSATTNANGLVTLQIGKGLPMVGSFADIDWANGPYFAVSDIDPDGGTNYRATIVQQILSVPYALYAERAANCTNEELERRIEINEAQIERLYRIIDSLRSTSPSAPCLEPFRIVVEQTACDSYEWHGNTYTESGDYIHTATTSAGCDSVVTLRLKVYPSVHATDNQTAEGSFVWIDGNTYTESGDYTYTTTTAAGCDSTVTLHLTVTQPAPQTEDGALMGQFAVSATKKVRFSQGNLQYQASSKTWRFAEHQYDFVGANNSNISSSYSGWIDLFGWGTSGWKSGATYYQPYSTNTNNGGYKIGGNAQNDLTGNYAKADWGVNNAITNGGGQAGLWRTLANAEWDYLINGRTTAFVSNGTTYNICYCRATVANHAGLIIFPDSYTLPAGLPMPNESGTFADYSLSKAQWNGMEAAGAVFLPAAGYRNGTTISDADAVGIYWTTTHYNDNNAYRFYISRGSVNATSYHNRSRGFSVRLVQELPDPCENGTSATTEVQTACDNYEWHGNIYTESTTATYTTINAAGCDSVVTLNLTINHPTTGSVEQTAEGTFTWVDGNTYTESGDYTYTIEGGNAAGCDSTVTLHLSITQYVSAAVEGVLPGAFSVSATKKVRFSQGNLQYQASSKTWRFAEKQYDIAGYDNRNISSSYAGWTDLFGWGTSGWKSGATYYMPYNSSTSNAGYKVGGNAQNDLTGDYAKADWGVNNAISNGGGEAGQWRTPASDEWEYLLNGRTTTFSSNGTSYNIRYCKATVAGHRGLIVFPDQCEYPAGLPMPNAYNENADYAANVFTASQWYSMEAAGAVFLPAAGYRNGTVIDDPDTMGSYWSSTHYNDNNAYRLSFSSGSMNAKNYHNRSRGFSVRLVQEMPDPCDGNTSATTDIQTACDNYEWHGNIYTESTTATYTTINAAGCDSVVTLRLTINHPTTGSVEQTAEGTYTWIDGNTYTESGDYTYTIEGGNAAGCDSTVTLHLSITQYVSAAVEGVLPGAFSVSASNKVRFSQGNLQYQASSKTWRFAEKQYDIAGYDNRNISSSYAGWTDLFGWGTSGWKSGATYYMPYNSSTSNAGYKVGGNAQNDLTGDYAKADWGVNNAISNGGNEAGQWRTPTSDEWEYLLNGRSTTFVSNGSTYSIRYCKATVAGHRGIIVFPDQCEYPAGLPMPNAYNENADYAANVFTASQWYIMEAAGAVFLPAAGYRNGTVIDDPDTMGSYWSSTHYNDNNAYRLSFSSGSMNAKNYHNRSRGFSVRLVQDESNTAENEGGNESDDWVDLGLPSGLLWATRNVGASSPEDYGDYFAWGETQSKSNYSWETYRYANGSHNTLTKYCTRSDYGYNGFTDNLTTLTASDDAASVNVSDSRMPTRGEWQELTEKCTWDWTTQNGVNGYRVTGRNGNVIFLPAAGYRWNIDTYVVGSVGYYWSLSLDEDGPNYAWTRSLYSEGVNWTDIGDRRNGFSVRPVKATGVTNPCPGTATMGDTTATAEGSILWHGNTYTESGDYTYTTTTMAGCDSIVTLHLTIMQPWTDDDWVDLGLPSGLLWAKRNLGANSPEDGGDYFAWGETRPKENYSWETYRYANGSYNTLTKYCTDSYYGHNGFTDNMTTLTSSDDAAAVNVSGSRMPTKDEWQELRSKCTWTWTTRNGVGGMRVTGPNGNVLFLPAARARSDEDSHRNEDYGQYWSSSLSDGGEDGSSDAWFLGFISYYINWGDYADRYVGSSIRPVREGNGSGNSGNEGAVNDEGGNSGENEVGSDERTVQIENGALPGVFSVSTTEQVRFSQGNLQYTTTGSHQCADGTTQSGTWRFAERQNDIVGEANKNISSTYTGWIDLFGWGTSGWSGGITAYQPYSTSTDLTDYILGGSSQKSLTHNYKNADWGVYNAISNGGNRAGLWRTLTNDEWNYLLRERPASFVYDGNTYDIRYCRTRVSYIEGVILFPDGFVLPDGIPLPDEKTYCDDDECMESSEDEGFYILTESQWNVIEAAGAVFLPLSYRIGSDFHWCYFSPHEEPYIQTWSSTAYKGTLWNSQGFTTSRGRAASDRYYGKPVRLVQGLNGGSEDRLVQIVDGMLPGEFAVSEKKQVRFSQGNLQYTTTGSHRCADGSTKPGTWRFAEYQYEFVGYHNSNASETYTGWIDVFRWGSSGWTIQPTYFSYTGGEMFEEDFNYYWQHDITGDYKNGDWGVYNSISNGGDRTGMWRTLSSPEWDFLLNTRSASFFYNGIPYNIRYCLAYIDQSINGLILFPDRYTHPEGIPLPNTYNTTGSFWDNRFTETEWNRMEAAGAVFLPAAGLRDGSQYEYLRWGEYWTSTRTGNGAGNIYFLSTVYDTYSGIGENEFFYSAAVRLVR